MYYMGFDINCIPTALSTYFIIRSALVNTARLTLHDFVVSENEFYAVETGSVARNKRNTRSRNWVR